MNITKGYSGEENVCRRTNPIPTWNWKNLKLNSIIETPALSSASVAPVQ